MELDIRMLEGPLAGAFDAYEALLLAENAKYNLTAITDHEEIRVKHFLDSLSLTTVFDLSGKTLMDLGSGAGFPGVPLAIATPGLTVQLVESNGKKARFLSMLSDSLSLKNVAVSDGRVELLPVSFRARFDIVTARAVGATSLLLELGLPFLKEGGELVLYKGTAYEAELAEARGALSALGARVEAVKEYDLPQGMGRHALVIVRKTAPTPARYPRPFAQIKKKPL